MAGNVRSSPQSVHPVPGQSVRHVSSISGQPREHHAFTITERQLRPFGYGQLPRVSDRCPHHPGVGDNCTSRQPFGRQGIQTRHTTCLQHRCGLATRRRVVKKIGRPCIERRRADAVPSFSFPLAKMHLHKAGQETRRRMQGFSQFSAPLQRAGDDRQIGGNLLTQGSSRRGDVMGRHVELAVADAFGNLRPRVADQENLHSIPV